MQDSLMHMVGILLSYVFSTNPIFYLENARREIAVGNLQKSYNYIQALLELVEGSTVDMWIDFMGG